MNNNIIPPIFFGLSVVSIDLYSCSSSSDQVTKILIQSIICLTHTMSYKHRKLRLCNTSHDMISHSCTQTHTHTCTLSLSLSLSRSFSHIHSQYSTLTRKFKDVMEEYNNVQEKYREKNKERIQKQLQYGELANSYIRS